MIPAPAAIALVVTLLWAILMQLATQVEEKDLAKCQNQGGTTMVKTTAGYVCAKIEVIK